MGSNLIRIERILPLKTDPIQTRPELLQHPRLPMPLHGLNPRTLKGADWWDGVRRQAYAAHGQRCWACGVPAAEAIFSQRLEAHEAYRIDYKKQVAEMVEVVALCHACHNFIHNGRLLNLLGSGQIAPEMFVEILRHGFAVLRAARLKPHLHAVEACEEGFKLMKARGLALPEWAGQIEALRAKALKPKVETGWEKWRLVIDGTAYAPLFASEKEWTDHFSGG